MSLTERSRAALYQGLITVINDEQAVQEMMSYFPARDVEEPVTKEFLRAELAANREQICTELRSETLTLGRELRVEMAAQREELSAATATLGRDLRSEIHRLGLINVGSLVAFAGVVIAAVRL